MIKKIAQPLVGIIFLVGMILKFMHLPGAGIMIFVGLSSAALLLMLELIQVTGESLISQLYKLAVAAGAIYVAAVMFKVMHWPGANIMLIVSMATLGLILVLSALKMRKWYFALLPLLFSVTLVMALFKILHWPRPPYLLYGSYFAFITLLSGVLFYRSQALKTSDGGLSKNYTLIGGLALLLLAVELKIKYYPTLLGIDVNPMRVAETFVFAGIVAVIHRQLVNKPYSPELQKDYQMLKTIQGVFLMMLVMMVLVAANL